MPIKRIVKPNKQSLATQSQYFDDIVSTSLTHIVTNVPAGSLIKIFPETSGTANVYSTQRPIEKANSDADINVAQSLISGSINRSWDAWGAGSVTALTIQQAQGPLEGVCIVVTTGTWSLEVSCP